MVKEDDRIDWLWGSSTSCDSKMARPKGGKRAKGNSRGVRQISASIFSGDTKGWLANLELEIPQYDFRGRPWHLNNAEMELVRENIEKCDTTNVGSIIVAKGQFSEHEENILALKQKRHDDYDGIVLCKEVIPNPPIRGDYGCAFIPLKEGAIPQRQKNSLIWGEGTSND